MSNYSPLYKTDILVQELYEDRHLNIRGGTSLNALEKAGDFVNDIVRGDKPSNTSKVASTENSGKNVSALIIEIRGQAP
ncbi:hypothetical protein L3V77_10595 [Vibrio sp. DW001]|uniref:hypothetical protein n=1 Tax=Vibrio sp. DW001 TaxID=2912315 RepID=UPI0023AFB67B|nr:hypothetical protein [Vibrio sp. DW001]WED25515.1 hypothetical protein L3V77_10595 [Vibrio sp. DW001]